MNSKRVWESLIEAKKLKRTKKRKAVGNRPRSLSNILKRAKQRNIAPGIYDVEGNILVVDSYGRIHVRCPECGELIDSYLDYVTHRQQHSS